MGSVKKLEASPALLLRGLITRAGVSYGAFAKGIGYKGASGIQRYVDPNQFTKAYLPIDIAERAAQYLAGKGTPPITEEEVLRLAGIPSMDEADQDLIAGLVDISQRALKHIQDNLQPQHNRYAKEIEDINAALYHIKKLKAVFKKAPAND